MRLTNENRKLALIYLSTMGTCLVLIPTIISKTYLEKKSVGFKNLTKTITKRSTDKLKPREIELPYLHDEILKAKGTENIFFMWPLSDRLRYRALCAAETWSFHNPKFNVWFVLTLHTAEDSDHLLERLQNQYPNLKFVVINLSRAFEGTLFEDLANRQAWRESEWPGTMLSDLLRLALVAKHGGYYADTDALLFKNMTGIKNFAGLYDDKNLDSAIFHFDADHPFLIANMETIAADFNPADYSYNGPKALTRTAQRLCGTKYYKNKLGPRTYEQCHGLNILHHDRFFQPHNKYHNCEVYFQQDSGVDIDKIIDDFAYGIHVCNVVTRVVKVEPNSYYDIAAKRWCPVTYYTATFRTDFW